MFFGRIANFKESPNEMDKTYSQISLQASQFSRTCLMKIFAGNLGHFWANVQDTDEHLEEFHFSMTPDRKSDVVVVVKRLGSGQTQIMKGYQGAKVNHPNYKNLKIGVNLKPHFTGFNEPITK